MFYLNYDIHFNRKFAEESPLPLERPLPGRRRKSKFFMYAQPFRALYDNVAILNDRALSIRPFVQIKRGEISFFSCVCVERAVFAFRICCRYLPRTAKKKRKKKRERKKGAALAYIPIRYVGTLRA